jgi:hypothetical protein
MTSSGSNGGGNHKQDATTTCGAINKEEIQTDS